MFSEQTEKDNEANNILWLEIMNIYDLYFKSKMILSSILYFLSRFFLCITSGHELFDCLTFLIDNSEILKIMNL